MSPRLAPVVPIPGQGYGKQTKQVQASRAVRAAGEAIAERAPQPQLPPRPQITPVDLDAPSERPWEPLTAGMDIGPGPGSEALGLQPLTPLDRLLRMYRLDPNPDLLKLIVVAQNQAGNQR